MRLSMLFLVAVVSLSLLPLFSFGAEPDLPSLDDGLYIFNEKVYAYVDGGTAVYKSNIGEDIVFAESGSSEAHMFSGKDAATFIRDAYAQGKLVHEQPTDLSSLGDFFADRDASSPVTEYRLAEFGGSASRILVYEASDGTRAVKIPPSGKIISGSPDEIDLGFTDWMPSIKTNPPESVPVVVREPPALAQAEVYPEYPEVPLDTLSNKEPFLELKLEAGSPPNPSTYDPGDETLNFGTDSATGQEFVDAPPLFGGSGEDEPNEPLDFGPLEDLDKNIANKEKEQRRAERETQGGAGEKQAEETPPEEDTLKGSAPGPLKPTVMTPEEIEEALSNMRGERESVEEEYRTTMMVGYEEQEGIHVPLQGSRVGFVPDLYRVEKSYWLVGRPKEVHIGRGVFKVDKFYRLIDERGNVVGIFERDAKRPVVFDGPAPSSAGGRSAAEEPSDNPSSDPSTAIAGGAEPSSTATGKPVLFNPSVTRIKADEKRGFKFAGKYITDAPALFGYLDEGGQDARSRQLGSFLDLVGMDRNYPIEKVTDGSGEAHYYDASDREYLLEEGVIRSIPTDRHPEEIYFTFDRDGNFHDALYIPRVNLGSTEVVDVDGKRAEALVGWPTGLGLGVRIDADGKVTDLFRDREYTLVAPDKLGTGFVRDDLSGDYYRIKDLGKPKGVTLAGRKADISLQEQLQQSRADIKNELIHFGPAPYNTDDATYRDYLDMSDEEFSKLTLSSAERELFVKLRYLEQHDKDSLTLNEAFALEQGLEIDADGNIVDSTDWKQYTRTKTSLVSLAYEARQNHIEAQKALETLASSLNEYDDAIFSQFGWRDRRAAKERFLREHMNALSPLITGGVGTLFCDYSVYGTPWNKDARANIFADLGLSAGSVEDALDVPAVDFVAIQYVDKETLDDPQKQGSFVIGSEQDDEGKDQPVFGYLYDVSYKISIGRDPFSFIICLGDAQGVNTETVVAEDGTEKYRYCRIQYQYGNGKIVPPSRTERVISGESFTHIYFIAVPWIDAFKYLDQNHQGSRLHGFHNVYTSGDADSLYEASADFDRGFEKTTCAGKTCLRRGIIVDHANPQGQRGSLPSASPVSCTDGIKNGGESGLDCGGPCIPCDEKSDTIYDDGVPANDALI